MPTSPRRRRARLALVVPATAVLALLAPTAAAPAPAEGADDAPDTAISGGPQDQFTPGDPVTRTARPSLQLSASEPASFNCAVNARAVPCQAGLNVLTGLEPGPQVFVAQAVDQDGHFDTTPATLTFFVPLDLEPGGARTWKRVRSRASYDGDYVATATKGARLRLGKVAGVRELRLYAPIGPRLGKVAVRVGRNPWIKVRLRSATRERLHVFELRAPDATRLSGVVQIKALKVPRHGAVAVDAIVAR
jgi:hypothetical protein